jgi:hypothetical protein
VTDKGFKELARVENLSSLNLCGTGITDAGLAELASLRSLASLCSGERNKLTRAGIAELKRPLPELVIAD